jgi:hypothetical protein|tara:strand:- start:1322 stop:1576 length:255 start_codon:yes stop_codon:yes gene_type:complete
VSIAVIVFCYKIIYRRERIMIIDQTEEYWRNKHAKRKKQILNDLEKYFKVRNKTNIEILNLRFDHEIKKLQEELNNLNQLLEVI